MFGVEITSARANRGSWPLLWIVQLLLHWQCVRTMIIDNHAHLYWHWVAIRAIQVLIGAAVRVIRRSKLVDVDHLMSFATLIGNVPNRKATATDATNQDENPNDESYNDTGGQTTIGRAPGRHCV